MLLLISFPYRIPASVTYRIPFSYASYCYLSYPLIASCGYLFHSPIVFFLFFFDSLILLLSLSNSFQQHSLFPFHFHRDMGGRGRKLRLFPHCLTGAALLLYTVYLLLPPHSSNIIPKQHASLNSPQRYMLTTDTHKILQRVADYFHHILRNIIPKQHASLNSSQQYMMLTTERQEIPKIQRRVSGFSAIF